MKNLKILTFALFLAVIIASLCPLTVFATENAPVYTEDQLIDMCAGNYAYDYLGKMQNGEALQKLYCDIDAKAKAFHIDPSAALIDGTHAFFVDFSVHGLTADEAMLVWRFYRDCGRGYACLAILPRRSSPLLLDFQYDRLRRQRA